MADKPVYIRYETEGMAIVREVLTGHSADMPVTDDEVDTFAKCLTILSRKGFSLKGPPLRAIAA